MTQTVPLGETILAAEVLGPVRELADALEAEMVLLHVVELPDAGAVEAYPYGQESELEVLLAESRHYLEGVAEGMRAGGRTVATRAVLGSPASMVARVAREEGADVIAIATHGRGGVSRLVMGSVATATVQWTNVPVLVVRPVALPGAVTWPEAAALALGPAVVHAPNTCSRDLDRS